MGYQWHAALGWRGALPDTWLQPVCSLWKPLTATGGEESSLGGFFQKKGMLGGLALADS